MRWAFAIVALACAGCSSGECPSPPYGECNGGWAAVVRHDDGRPFAAGERFGFYGADWSCEIVGGAGATTVVCPNLSDFSVTMPDASTLRIKVGYGDSFELMVRDAEDRTVTHPFVSAGRRFCRCSHDDVSVTIP